MALRRNVRPLLCWDQCRLVIVSSRRQTVHRDQLVEESNPFTILGLSTKLLD